MSYRNTKPFTPTVTERPNTPQIYTIAGLESRYNGGRAYKVMDKDSHYFDMREDVILDTIAHCGIESGGKLGGLYVWGKLKSQFRLVRHESALYYALLESQEKSKLERIKTANLEKGGIYKGRVAQRFMYLGPVRIGGSKRTLWMRVYKIDGEPLEQLQKIPAPYCFDTKSGHSMIEKVGQYDISNLDIRGIINQSITDYLKSEKARRINYDETTEACLMRAYNHLLHMEFIS